jgi:type VI secretion system protein ImpH
MTDHEQPTRPDGNPGDALAVDASVTERLFREPFRFEFFQAVRLLERIYPQRSPVGRHEHPANEVLRFSSHVSMSFPASEVFTLEPAAGEGRPAEMSVTFLGLAGAAGVLPRHYTVLLTDPQMRRFVAPLRAFLDLFNHRFLSLFYRAWEKYRFPIAYERGRDDRFSTYLFSLIGMGMSTLRHRLQISDEILLHYAGLLARRPRPAAALEGLLQDYFGLPVTVEQFTGQWFLMNPDSLTQLGEPGQNVCLGVDAVLWERVWDPPARFRVKLGPMSLQRFREFLPGREAYRHAVELTRFYAGEEFGFEVQPVLDPEEVPPCVLGEERTSHLGWAMWLKTDPFEEPPTQPIFEARAIHVVAEESELEQA